MVFRSKKRKRNGARGVASTNEDKIPQSIVARKGSVGPYSNNVSEYNYPFNRKEVYFDDNVYYLYRTNSIKDFVNIAGPYGITHIILFSKGSTSPRMRIGCFPQGPTLHFSVDEYTLMRDIEKYTKKSLDFKSTSSSAPILIMNGFPNDNKRIELVMKTFQNMFPSIHPETIKISSCKRILLLQYEPVTDSVILRQYNIVRSVAGIGKAVKTIMSGKQLPDLSNMKDISEFIIGQEGEKEIEFEEGESTEFSIASSSSLGSRSSGEKLKQTIKLVEIGPRLRIRLVAVENGLFQGDLILNKQTEQEQKELTSQRAIEKKIQKKEKEVGKQEDEKNEVLRKKLIEEKKEDDRFREKRKQEKKENEKKKREEQKLKRKGKKAQKQ